MESLPRTVVKLSGPTDIVGMLPYRVGFQPTESVVVMCMHGPRKRSGLVLRHDLVPVDHEQELVELLAWHVRRSNATAVIVVVYSEVPDHEGALPRRPFVDVLRRSLTAEVMETLLVRGGRWWSYDCRQACCPPEGTPVPTDQNAAVNLIAAESVVRGQAVLADRSALERSIVPKSNPLGDAARAQAFEAAQEALVRAYEEGGSDRLGRETLELLESTARRWSEGSRDLTRLDAARIVLGLRDKAARDRAATLALDIAPESYLPLLVELCRHASAHDAAPICTVLGWVAYLHGDGGLANVAVDRALTCEPGYTMAELLLTGLQGQVPPAEVRQMTRLARAEFDAIDRGERPRSPRELRRRVRSSSRRGKGGGSAGRRK